MTGAPGARGGPASLRTVSLRRRVTVLGVATLAGVMAIMLIAADVIFGAVSRGETNARLNDSAALADALARQGLTAEQIVEQLDTPSLQVRLVTTDGRAVGTAPARMEHPRLRGAGDGVGPGWQDGVLRRTLPDGSRLTLVADTEALTDAQQRLRRVLGIVGLGGLGLAAIVLLATTRVALAPLERMTALARSIARGNRGARLAPDRTNTELGRTAAAFDDMLDALEGAERQARQAAGTAARSEAQTRQFVADAAHELRTPLAGVQAAAEAAVSPGLDPAERERLHLLLLRETHRAGRLVEDLLALARIDAGLQLRREDVELRGLAEAEAERVRLLAPELTVHVAGELVSVPGDPQRLAQVLANLLDNARRYTPDGGTITVTVAQVDAGWTSVTVADTGTGVPPAERERIFDRLVRLDDARSQDGGAGLGLAIARGIARAHGGELRCVEPAAGEGVAFVLTLPAGPPITEPATG